MTELNNRDYLLVAAYEAGVSDPRELAAFMGQMEIESSGFKSMHENLRCSGARLMDVFPGRNGMDTLEKANVVSGGGPEAIANAIYGGEWGARKLGNSEAGDGWNFHGRGYVQLTGRDNYQRAASELHLDLIGNPDLAADRKNAADVAVHYWKSRVVANDHQLDVRNATHDINGGYKHLHERTAAIAHWERALTPAVMDGLSRGEVVLPVLSERRGAHSNGVLQQGENGPEVKRLQEALNERGANLPTTGYYGAQTKAAVEDFQREQGLEPDGKAGRDTRSALGIGQPALTGTQPLPGVAPAPMVPGSGMGDNLKEPSERGPFTPDFSAATGGASLRPSFDAIRELENPRGVGDARPGRDQPLFTQALQGLDKLGPEAGGYRNQDEKERIAGALAVKANEFTPPMREISDVVASKVNGNVFAIWVNPGNNLDVMRAHVDKAQAVNQPVADSLGKLEALTQQNDGQRQQVSTPTIDEPSRSTPMR